MNKKHFFKLYNIFYDADYAEFPLQRVEKRIINRSFLI